MSDWDFLHEMHDRGYSADDIALAAGVGYPRSIGPDTAQRLAADRAAMPGACLPN